MTKVLSSLVLLAAAAAAPAVACGGNKPAVKDANATDTTPSATTADSPRPPPNPPNTPTASAVHISDEILKACGISAPNAYFAFDSANLRPDDANVLAQLVTCFTTGPLKGRLLKLVGHADPRGGSDYNMALGQSRSDAVQQYLVGHGMDKGKTDSSSRGAMDATGTDEPSWARDRRVDILLGQ
jgi:peptidoglycan-associated lipoprotein